MSGRTLRLGRWLSLCLVLFAAMVSLPAFALVPTALTDHSDFWDFSGPSAPAALFYTSTGFPTEPRLIGPTRGVAFGLIAISSILALGLAGLIAWSDRARSAHWPIAVFLAAISIALPWEYLLIPFADGVLSDFLVILRLGSALSFGLAVVMLPRFASGFPERIDEELIDRAVRKWYSGGTHELRGSYPFVRKIPYPDDVTRKHIDQYARLAGVIQSYWIVFAIVGVLVMVRFVEEFLFALFLILLIGMSLSSAALLLRAQSVGPRGERVYWISGGAAAAMIASAVLVTLPFALGPVLGDVGWDIYMAVWMGVGPFVMLTLLIASIGIAVLYQGAVDPRLAIRKTTLYGSLGVTLGFLFGGTEVALSDYVLAALGAPAGASSVLAGGTVAIAFGPLRSTFKRRIDHWVEEKLPATILAEAPRHRAIIIFSDIVGYSALTSENEDDALTMMSVFHRAARKVVDQYKGRLVKTMGDGVLMEFKDAPSAVTASQHLASSFGDACETLGLPEGQLRTGIHFGEVAKRRDGDLFGDAVNIASRLESEAEPGQIVVSQVVADQLEGVELEDLGERSLKNVPEPVRCWAVRI